VGEAVGGTAPGVVRLMSFIWDGLVFGLLVGMVGAFFMVART
jgi:hypothetical protein